MALDPAERELVEAVHPARIAEELHALVALPSVTGREEAIQEELGERLTSAGLEVRSLAADPAELRADPDYPGAEVERSSLPIVAGRLRGTAAGGRRVLLVGHVDVVPPGDRSAWVSDPFTPVVRDGALYGRGACDMKGGVVAAVEAMRVLAASGMAGRLAGEATFLSVPSEEDGGAGMLAAIRAGYTADLAVITEPTSLRVVTSQAGAVTFRLKVAGRGAHASMRRHGVSALEKLGLVLRGLEADEVVRNAAETDPLMRALDLPYPTIVGRVAGGEWASTVMDRVVAEGRYGVRIGETAADGERQLREVVAAACADDAWLRDHPAELEITGGRFSSATIPIDHPLPIGLADAAEAVLGRRPPFAGVPYGADMRLLVRQGATPTVIFGPGDAAVTHAPDEHVPLSEVADCARVLVVWLARVLAP